VRSACGKQVAIKVEINAAWHANSFFAFLLENRFAGFYPSGF
jgi:hypothetical protein